MVARGNKAKKEGGEKPTKDKLKMRFDTALTCDGESGVA
jgi:hypothetical protein